MRIKSFRKGAIALKKLRLGAGVAILVTLLSLSDGLFAAKDAIADPASYSEAEIEALLNSTNLQETESAIAEIGAAAAAGDRTAADHLIYLASHADDPYTTSVSVALANWAQNNSQFLITVLSEQSEETRRLSLELLNFGFEQGMAEARDTFAAAIAQLPPDSAVARSWQSAIGTPEWVDDGQLF